MIEMAEIEAVEGNNKKRKKIRKVFRNNKE